MNQQEIQREIRAVVETLGLPAAQKPSETPDEAEARQTGQLLELLALLSTCCDPVHCQRKVLGAAERLTRRARYRASEACAELFDSSYAKEERIRRQRREEQQRLQHGAAAEADDSGTDDAALQRIALRCRVSFLHHLNRLYTELAVDPWLHRMEQTVRVSAAEDALSSLQGCVVGQHRMEFFHVKEAADGAVLCALAREAADGAKDAGELRSHLARVFGVRARRIKVLRRAPPPYNTAVRVSNAVRPLTVAVVCEELSGVCRAMGAAFTHDEDLYHVILNGSVHVYEVCCRLVSHGLYREAILFLGWASQSCSSTLTLSQVKFLPWRIRLLHAIALCYDCIGEMSAAEKVAAEALRVCVELHTLETGDMVPPDPQSMRILSACISECQALVFRYQLMRPDADAAVAAQGKGGKGAPKEASGSAAAELVARLRASITGSPPGPSSPSIGNCQFVTAAVGALLGAVTDERKRVVYRAGLALPAPLAAAPSRPGSAAASDDDAGATSAETLLQCCSELLCPTPAGDDSASQSQEVHAPQVVPVPARMLLDFVKQCYTHAQWGLFARWSEIADANLRADDDPAAAPMLRELCIFRSLAGISACYKRGDGELEPFVAAQEALVEAVSPESAPVVFTTDVQGARAGETGTVISRAADSQFAVDVGGRTVADVPISALRCDAAELESFRDVALDAARVVYQMLTDSGSPEQIEILPHQAYDVIEATTDVMIRCSSFDVCVAASAALLFAKHCERTADEAGTSTVRTVAVSLPEFQASSPEASMSFRGVAQVSVMSIERLVRRVKLRTDLGITLQGTTVSHVVSGGPAATAGIRNAGVTVRCVDGRPVLSEQDVRMAVAEARKAGRDAIEIEIEDRDAKRRWLSRPLPLLRALVSSVAERRRNFLRNGFAPALCSAAAQAGASAAGRAVTSSPALVYKTLVAQQAEAERTIVRLRLRVGVELAAHKQVRQQHHRIALLKKREEQAAVFGALSAKERLVLSHEQERELVRPHVAADVERTLLAEARRLDGNRDGVRTAMVLIEASPFHTSAKDSLSRLNRAQAALKSLSADEEKWKAVTGGSDGAKTHAVSSATSLPSELLQSWLAEAAHRCGHDDLVEKAAGEVAVRFIVRGGSRGSDNECTIPRHDENPICFDSLNDAVALETPTPVLEAVARALLATAAVQLARGTTQTTLHDDPDQTYDPSRFRLGARQLCALRIANGLLNALRIADVTKNACLAVICCNRLFNCLLPVLQTKTKGLLTLRPLSIMSHVLVGLTGKFTADANLQALMARVLYELLCVGQESGPAGMPPALLDVCVARFADAWKIVHGSPNVYQSRYIRKLEDEIKRFHSEGESGRPPSAPEKGGKKGGGKAAKEGAGEAGPALNMTLREISTEDMVPLEYLELLDLFVFTFADGAEKLEKTGISLPPVYAAVAPHLQKNPERALSDMNRDYREHPLYPKLVTQAIVALCRSNDKSRLKQIEAAVEQTFATLNQRYVSLCKAEMLALQPLDEARSALRDGQLLKTESAPGKDEKGAAKGGKKVPSPRGGDDTESQTDAKRKLEEDLASQRANVCMQRFKTRLKYRKRRVELLKSDVSNRAHLNLVEATLAFQRVTERRSAAQRDWMEASAPPPAPPKPPAKGAAVEEPAASGPVDLDEEETKKFWKDEVETVRCLSRAIVLFSRVNRWKHAHNSMVYLYNAMRVMFAPPRFEHLPTPLPLPPKARSPDPSQHPPPGLRRYCSSLPRGQRVQDGLALIQKDIRSALCYMVTMLESVEGGFDMRDYVDSLNPLVVETWMDRSEPGGLLGLTTSLRARLSDSGHAATAERDRWERRRAQHVLRSRRMNGWAIEPVVIEIEKPTNILSDIGVVLDEDTVVDIQDGGPANQHGLTRRYILHTDPEVKWTTTLDPWTLAEINDQRTSPANVKDLVAQMSKEYRCKVVFEPPPDQRWRKGLREIYAEGAESKEDEFCLRAHLEEEERAARRHMAKSAEAIALKQPIPQSWTQKEHALGDEDVGDFESTVIVAAGVTCFIAASKLDLQQFMLAAGRGASCRFIGGFPDDLNEPMEIYESGVENWINLSKLSGSRRVTTSQTAVTIGGGTPVSLAAAALEGATKNRNVSRQVEERIAEISSLLNGRDAEVPTGGFCCDRNVLERLSSPELGVLAVVTDAVAQDKAEIPVDQVLAMDLGTAFVSALLVPFNLGLNLTDAFVPALSATERAPGTVKKGGDTGEKHWQDIPYRRRLGDVDLDSFVDTAVYFMKVLQFGELSPHPAGLRHGEDLNRLLRDHYAAQLIPLVMTFQARVGRVMTSNEELMAKTFRDMPRAATTVNSAHVALEEYRQSTEWHNTLERLAARAGPARSEIYREIASRFLAADGWLRQKHITLPSMKVMNELGQFHCEHLNTKEAGRTWKIGVDTALGEVDSWKSWRHLVTDTEVHTTQLGDEPIRTPKLLLERLGTSKLLLSVILLGRQSAQVYHSDQRAAVEHSLFGAWLTKAALSGCLSMPAREYDFRAVVPKDILLGVDCFSGSLGVDGVELTYALAHVANMCISVGHAALSLPPAALLEYIAGSAVRSREYVILARLLRSRALADMGDLSQAAEVLFSVFAAADLPSKALSQLGIVSAPLPVGAVDLGASNTDPSRGKKPEGKKGKQAADTPAPTGERVSLTNDGDLGVKENTTAIRALAHSGLPEPLRDELGPNLVRYTQLTQGHLLLRLGESDPSAAQEPNEPAWASPTGARDKAAMPKREEAKVQACAEALNAAEALAKQMEAGSAECGAARTDACHARYLLARVHRARGSYARAVEMLTELVATSATLVQTPEPATATGAARADTFRAMVSVRDVATWHNSLAELLIAQRRPAAAAEICRRCESLCARYDYLWGEREARLIRAEVCLLDGRPLSALKILTAPQTGPSDGDGGEDDGVLPPPVKRRTIQSAKARVLRSGRMRVEGKASAPHVDLGGVLDGMVVTVLGSEPDYTFVRREDGVQGFLPTAELRGEGEPPPQRRVAATPQRPPMVDEARAYDVQGRDSFLPRLLTVVAAAKTAAQQDGDDVVAMANEAQQLFRAHVEHCGCAPDLDTERWGSLAMRHLSVPARDLVYALVRSARDRARAGSADEAREMLRSAVQCARQCCAHALPRCTTVALFYSGRLARMHLQPTLTSLWGTAGVGTVTFRDAKQNAVVRLTPKDFPRARYVGTVIRKEREVIMVRWNSHAEGGPPAELAGRQYRREKTETRQWWDSHSSPEGVLQPSQLTLDPPADAADTAGVYQLLPGDDPTWKRADGKYHLGTGADGRWHVQPGTDFSATRSGVLSSARPHHGIPPSLVSRWTHPGEEGPFTLGSKVQVGPTADPNAGCLRAGEAGVVVAEEPQQRVRVRGPRGDVAQYRQRDLVRGESLFRSTGADTAMRGWQDWSTEQLRARALTTGDAGAAVSLLAEGAWFCAARGAHDHALLRGCLLEMCFVYGARHGDSREDRVVHALTATRLLLAACEVSRLSQRLHVPQLLTEPLSADGPPPERKAPVDIPKPELMPVMLAADVSELYRRDCAAQADWDEQYPAVAETVKSPVGKGADPSVGVKKPPLRTLVQWYSEALKDFAGMPTGARSSLPLELKLVAARRHFHEAVDPSSREPPYPVLPPQTPWFEPGQLGKLVERPDLTPGMLCSQMHALDDGQQQDCGEVAGQATHWFFFLYPSAAAPAAGGQVEQQKDPKKKGGAAPAPAAPTGAEQPQASPILGVVHMNQQHVQQLRQKALALRRILRQLIERVDELKARQADTSRRGGTGKGKEEKKPAKGGEAPAICAEEAEVREVLTLSDVGVCFTRGTLRVDVLVPGGAAERAGVRRGMQLVEVSGLSRQGREKRLVSRREDAELAFAIDAAQPKVAVFKLQDIVALEARYDMLRIDFWELMAVALRTSRAMADVAAGGKGRGRRTMQPPDRAPSEGAPLAILAAACVVSATAAADTRASSPPESQAARPDPLQAVDPPRSLQPPLELHKLCAVGDRIEVAEEIAYVLTSECVRLQAGAQGTVLGFDDRGNVRVDWDGGEVRWVYERDLLRLRNKDQRGIDERAKHRAAVASLLLQIFDTSGGVADASNSAAAREVGEWLHYALSLL